MERIGVMLAVAVALLWGTADLLAARSASTLGTFKATLVSQVCGLLLVMAFGALVLRCWPMPLSATAMEQSVLLGLMSGACGALGYLALYRALNLGPLALVSPLSSTSSTITLLLALVFLREQLSPLQLGCVSAVMLGVVLASTDGATLNSLQRKPQASWCRHGVPWAVAASAAFGVMDFGIGASASLSNWLLPVIWTRLFSVLVLLLLSLVMRTSASVEGAPVRSAASPTELPGAGGQGYLSLFLEDDTRSLPMPFQLSCLYRSKQTRSYYYSHVDSRLLLACAAGLAENAAVLGFSFASRLATTGMTSAIASGYALVVMLYGLVIYREKLSGNQWSGIALFMSSLILLAL